MFEGLQEEQLPAAIEAMLFVADEPVSAITLAQMLEVETSAAQTALVELQERLRESASGIQLCEVAGGWRLYTNPVFHELLEKYVLSWDTRKLSSAALEVLAIIAYTQPTTRAQVSAVRGVTSDGPLNTLIERGYVKEAGVADTPGNPTVYTTTRTFLEKYGLTSVKELPDLLEFAPDEKTAQLIRERLGAPSMVVEIPAGELSDESADSAIPTPEQMIAEATASVLGVVDKIDFDQLTFNTDDE